MSANLNAIENDLIWNLNLNEINKTKMKLVQQTKNPNMNTL